MRSVVALALVLVGCQGSSAREATGSRGAGSAAEGSASASSAAPGSTASGSAAPGSAAPGSAAPSSAPAGSAPATARTVDVRFDRRVELVSILCRLADYPEYRAATGGPYLDAVDAHFAAHAKHAAVATLRALRQTRGIAYDAPMVFAVHLDDALALQHADELADIDARWQGVDAAALAEQVRDFARVAELDAFRTQQRAYYASVEAWLGEAIAKEDPVPWFDRVFGPAGAAFTVVPSAIAGPNSFGPRATDAGGGMHMYQILGLGSRAGGLEPADLPVLVVHEMAHSYINPVFAKHRAQLLPAGEKIYALVAKQMAAQAYRTAGTLLDESGVRAVTVLYMRERHGDAAGARAARGEQRRGFVWINELAEVFRALATSGTQDLEGHMPRIVAFFDQLAASYATGLPPVPFLGPVDAVHQRDPVWVIPKGAAYDYARGIARKLRPSGAIVEATRATLAEQRGKDLVAVGTPADNPVVDFVVRQARWTITPDAIALGSQRFTGKGLVLVACWFQRDAAARGVAVYTSADAANLAGINGVHHGTTDWLVARKEGTRFTVLASGDFPRGLDAAWLLPGEDSAPPPPGMAPAKTQ